MAAQRDIGTGVKQIAQKPSRQPPVALGQRVLHLDGHPSRRGKRLDRLDAAHRRTRQHAVDAITRQLVDDRVGLAAAPPGERPHLVVFIPPVSILGHRVTHEKNRHRSRSAAHAATTSRSWT